MQSSNSLVPVQWTSFAESWGLVLDSNCYLDLAAPVRKTEKNEELLNQNCNQDDQIKKLELIKAIFQKAIESDERIFSGDIRDVVDGTSVVEMINNGTYESYIKVVENVIKFTEKLDSASDKLVQTSRKVVDLAVERAAILRYIITGQTQTGEAVHKYSVSLQEVQSELHQLNLQFNMLRSESKEIVTFVSAFQEERIQDCLKWVYVRRAATIESRIAHIASLKIHLQT